MDVIEEMNQKHQEDLDRLHMFRLFDHDFMMACLLLRILLDESNIKVSHVCIQVFAENLLNRSVRLDVLATDHVGKNTNVETTLQMWIWKKMHQI